jgi:hypothetical protein
MDIELVSIEEADAPDAFRVLFDVIYAGETWCRSLVCIGSDLSAQLGREEPVLIRTARDALLELLVVESVPVSFQLRLSAAGCTVVARGNPRANLGGATSPR